MGIEDNINQWVADLLPAGKSYTPEGGRTYASGMGRRAIQQSNTPITAQPVVDPTEGLNLDGNGPQPAAVNGKVAANAGNTRDYDATLRLQNALNAKGAGLAVDGINGPLTKAAMAKYGMGGGTDYGTMGDGWDDPLNVGSAPTMPNAPTPAPAIRTVQPSAPTAKSPAPTQNPSGVGLPAVDSTENINPTAPIEDYYNTIGGAIDYGMDTLAEAPVWGMNTVDSFLSRPGNELRARVNNRNNSLKDFQDQSNGNIGTAGYNLLHTDNSGSKLLEMLKQLGSKAAGVYNFSGRE